MQMYCRTRMQNGKTAKMRIYIINKLYRQTSTIILNHVIIIKIKWAVNGLHCVSFSNHNSMVSKLMQMQAWQILSGLFSVQFYTNYTVLNEIVEFQKLTCSLL